MNIGKSIELALVHKQMKKIELAKAMGLSANSISTLCKTPTCSGKTLDKLCTVFNMKASDFVALGE